MSKNNLVVLRETFEGKRYVDSTGNTYQLKRIVVEEDRIKGVIMEYEPGAEILQSFQKFLSDSPAPERGSRVNESRLTHQHLEEVARKRNLLYEFPLRD